MSTVRKAVIYSSLSRYCLMAIGLLSTILVARLLSPAEIGTFAIASAIVMVLSEFRLLGAGIYLVREAELTDQKIRRALGVTFIISYTLGFFVIAAAGWVSDFYEITELRSLFYLLSTSFFLAPFVSIPTSLLQREMKFKLLFFVWVGGVLSGLLVTLAAIWFGLSFYSLALGLLANTIVQVVLASIFVERRYWLPIFMELGPIVKLGVYSSASNMLKRSLLTIPDMVIGKIGTTTQVGIFSRGLGFINFLSSSFQQGISPVALPYLSEKIRKNEDVNSAYLSASLLMGGVLWPVLGVAAVSSLPVIRFFFGDQWDAAAPIASIIAFWAMMRTVHAFSPELLLSAGYERLLMIRELILLVVCFLGLYFLYPYGLYYAAYSFAIVGVFDFLVTSWILKSCFRIGLFSLILSWSKNLLLTIICIVTAISIDFVIGFSSSPPWFVVLCLASFVSPLWYLCLGLLKHPLWLEIRPGKVFSV